MLKEEIPVQYLVITWENLQKNQGLKVLVLLPLAYMLMPWLRILLLSALERMLITTGEINIVKH